MSELSAYNDYFSKARHRKVYITLLPSREVIDANQYLLQESISLEESLYSDENIRFGACESSCLRMTISRELNIPKDSVFDISFSSEGDAGALIDSDGNYIVNDNNERIAFVDNSSFTETKLGRFKVMSVKPTKDRMYQDLVCYDSMNYILNANVVDWYNNLTFPMSLYNFRRSFFYHIGIREVTTTLINDNFMIQGGFAVSDEISGKTIIEAICELNGVFGHITKDNEFEYISIPGSETVELDHYQNGTCAYEDYVTDAFTGVIAYSEDGNVGDSVGTDTNPYLIQNNYLLWGSEGTQDIEDALTNLLTKISSVQFRPFTVKTYGNPMLPLGTPITMTSLNGSISSVVMSKYMSGIQNLRDELSAVGDKAFPNDINSTKKEIMRSKGTRTMVEKLNGKVCVKIDSNGNLGLAEVGADPDDGLTYVTISAQNIDIESDTVSFNNDGYEIRGDVYTTKITPDNNEIYCNYKEIDHDTFPYVDFENDTKAVTHINTYVYGEMYSDWDEVEHTGINLVEVQLRSFNLQLIQNNTMWKGSTSNFSKQVVVTGTHFAMPSDKWASYLANGGSVDDNGNLTPISNMYRYFTDDPMELSILQNVPEARPVIAYMDAENAMGFLQMFHVVSYPAYFQNFKGKMPVVICPNISISQENVFDWNNKWGGNDYGLVNTTGQLWNRVMNNPVTRAGTIVKTITTANPQRVFTASELANIFGTQSGGTYTAYVMNGDHAVQGADIIATYIQSGEVYVRFNATPTAGAYRFNYMISRF